MKKIVKINQKKLIKTLISTISAILGILLIPQFIHFLVYTPSPFGFIKPGEESQWIGFFGSIIGGSLTLIGVWWTINRQNRNRKEDFIIMNKPIITVTSVKCRDYQACINNIFDLNIKIRNCGKSEARNIKVFIHLSGEYSNDYCALCNPSYLNILLPGNDIKIVAHQMFLYKYTGVLGESFEVIINYQDLFNNYHIAKQIIRFDRDNLINKSKKNIVFKFDDLALETGKLEFPKVQKNL